MADYNYTYDVTNIISPNLVLSKINSNFQGEKAYEKD